MTGRLEELRDLAGPVSRETLERLEAFESEFRKWSARINLAAPSTLEDLWRRHILDSVQLGPLAPDALRWLDLGSGGGFPGAIMAILLAGRQGAHIDLIESNHKKASFLRSILSTCGAPATVHVCRIEEAVGRIGRPQIITARALAPLPRLLALAEPWLHGDVKALFHKGRDYATEVAESHDAWQFDLVEHRSRIDAASRILELSGLKPGRSA